MFSYEHLILAFILGLVTGVTSTIFFSQRELSLESGVSLLIMSIWLAMHTYGFFMEVQVPWLLDFAGFGAAGNFIGISLEDIKGKLPIKTK